MSDITPVSGPALDRVEAAPMFRPADRAESRAPARPEDQVELSEVGLYLSRLRDLPVRQDLVDRVRREIDAGTYETDERIDAAVRELQQDLDPLA